MDNLGPGDEVAIVVLGERATVLTDFTDEPAALRRALDSLTNLASAHRAFVRA